MKELDNLIWVIRAAGERTATLCRQLIQEIADGQEIHFIEEEPFNNALIKGFEIAEQAEAKWMVCIDADVLIEQQGMLELIKVAQTVEEDVCYVQGLTIDRFIPIIRSAGNGIYRTSIASKAKLMVPKNNATNRPETATMQKLLESGYKMFRTNIIVGIHDYEQYYTDIYRKIFLHARKHKNVIEEVSDYWRSKQEDHPEFKIALAAMKISETYPHEIPVQKSFKKLEARKVLFFLGLTERADLDSNAYSAETVTAIIRAFQTNQSLQQKKFPEYSKNYFVAPPKKGKLPKPLQRLTLAVGDQVMRLGARVSEWASD